MIDIFLSLDNLCKKYNKIFIKITKFLKHFHNKSKSVTLLMHQDIVQELPNCTRELSKARYLNCKIHSWANVKALSEFVYQSLS